MLIRLFGRTNPDSHAHDASKREGVRQMELLLPRGQNSLQDNLIAQNSRDLLYLAVQEFVKRSGGPVQPRVTGSTRSDPQLPPRQMRTVTHAASADRDSHPCEQPAGCPSHASRRQPGHPPLPANWTPTDSGPTGGVKPGESLRRSSSQARGANSDHHCRRGSRTACSRFGHILRCRLPATR